MNNKSVVAISTLAILAALFALTLSRKDSGAVAKPGKSHTLSNQAEHLSSQGPKLASDPRKGVRPDLKNQVTLEELCAQTGRDLKFPVLTKQESEARNTALWLNLTDSIQQFAKSSSVDLQLTSIFFETDAILRMNKLKKVVGLSPDDPLVLWTAVNACTKDRQEVECPLREWEDRLIAVDGQNGEAWIRVAANRYAEGNEQAAFEAMQQAAAAAESGIYWTDHIELIQRSLASTGSYEFTEGASTAIGVAAAHMPIYSHITIMCREQSAKSQDWAYACLNYSELAIARSKTELGVRIGMAMKKLTLESIGELEQAEQMKVQIEQRKEEHRLAFSGSNNLFSRLGMANPTLFAFYLDNLKQHGELKSAHIMEKEIARLLNIQPELACSAVPSYL